MIRVTTLAALLAELQKNENAQVEIDIAGEVSLEISTGKPFLRFLTALRGSVRVALAGSSAPSIETRGSSAPSIETRGSSAPSIETWESSAPRIETRESSAPRIVTWGSSAPRIVTWGSSAPSIETWGSSAPRIETRESSAPSIETWESSAPSIVAKGYTMLRLFGANARAIAAANVSVLLHRGASAIGGRQLTVSIDTPEAWCDYYGVEVRNGVALLYKAVNDDFRSPRGALYAPGNTPVAPDWDGGAVECGGGLHFSPSPAMALEFHEHAKRFCACPVRLADVAVHQNGAYPQKVKAQGCCEPCFEVDRRGTPIGDAPEWGKAPAPLAKRKRTKTATA